MRTIPLVIFIPCFYALVDYSFEYTELLDLYFLRTLLSDKILESKLEALTVISILVEVCSYSIRTCCTYISI